MAIASSTVGNPSMRNRIRHVAIFDLMKETPYAINPPNLMAPTYQHGDCLVQS